MTNSPLNSIRVNTVPPNSPTHHLTTKQGIHTGRVVGQIAAQIGPYYLLWCRRFKKIVPTRRYYRADRRVIYRGANCLKYCKQIVFEIFAPLSAL